MKAIMNKINEFIDNCDELNIVMVIVISGLIFAVYCMYVN